MEEKYLVNQKMLNELAQVIDNVLNKYFVTGYNPDGSGKFVECNIDFKYLNNAGGRRLADLELYYKKSNCRLPDIEISIKNS